MVIWHNTEDAPRTPAEVFQNDKVVLWIGSYPIELDQSIDVEIAVSGKNSETKNYTIEAEWRYNDYSKNNSYWTAIIGPFRTGDKIEYKIRGVGPDKTPHAQIDNFTILDRRRLKNDD
ncbi:MAG: hypothetical protein ACLP05_07860 [Candidatus Kryptoniota bacterium]